MEASLKLGRLWGIPVGLHVSWFLIFGLVTWTLASGYFPAEYPGLPTTGYWLLGAVTSLLFFGSVLAHELGHAWLARRNQIPVRAITLFIFGGVAQIAREPRTPGAEFRIAIAGSRSFSVVSFQIVPLLPGAEDFVEVDAAPAGGDGGLLVQPTRLQVRQDFGAARIAFGYAGSVDQDRAVALHVRIGMAGGRRGGP